MNDELIKNPYHQKLSLLETVLTNRGIKIENITNYLNTTEDDIIDPKKIKNIDQGAKLLISHIKNNDDIFIQVDADADGFTSAAVLINYLNKLFPSFVINHIKYRVHDAKQHGIILETISPDEVRNAYPIMNYFMFTEYPSEEQIEEKMNEIDNSFSKYPILSQYMDPENQENISKDKLASIDYINDFLNEE